MSRNQRGKGSRSASGSGSDAGSYSSLGNRSYDGLRFEPFGVRSAICNELCLIQCLKRPASPLDFRLTLLADGVFCMNREWTAGVTHGESEKSLHRQNGHKHKDNGGTSGDSYGPLDDDYSDLDVYEGNGRAPCSVSRCKSVSGITRTRAVRRSQLL